MDDPPGQREDGVDPRVQYRAVQPEIPEGVPDKAESAGERAAVAGHVVGLQVDDGQQVEQFRRGGI